MPDILLRTIGSADGRNYASFTAAEAAVQDIGTSANLVTNDEAIVFDVYNDSVYTESGATITFGSTLTTDATRNVTYRAAAGEQHTGTAGTGVRFAKATTSQIADVDDDNTVFDGISFGYTVTNGFAPAISLDVANEGVQFRNCYFESGGGTGENGISLYGVDCGVSGNRMLVQNCVFEGYNDAGIRVNASEGSLAYDLFMDVVNCTFYGCTYGIHTTENSATATHTYRIVNCLSLNITWGDWHVTTYTAGTITTTGSTNNFGEETVAADQFPGTGTPYPITFTTSLTPGAGDWAICTSTSDFSLVRDADNDVMGIGVGPESNSLVPTTDIVGTPRYGAVTDPGAFQVPLETITRTIGTSLSPSRDYASFTAAEVGVGTPLSLTTDMTRWNQRVVFEAYDDSVFTDTGVFFTDTFTTDATRNVTWRAAAGQQHDGTTGNGVRINPTATGDVFTVWTDDTVFDGISFAPTTAASFTTILFHTNGCDGLVARNCLFVSPATAPTFWHGVRSQYGDGEVTVENCAFDGFDGTDGAGIGMFADGNTITSRSTNCTFHNCDSAIVFNHTTGGSLTAVIINAMALDSVAADWSAVGGETGTLTTTGSTNNFGEYNGTGEFPGGDASNPYTSTTSTSPGAGTWAIFTSTSDFSLVRDADNDAMGLGVGPDSNALVPATDIVGTPRYGDVCDPGAFQIPLSTIIRTVGGTSPTYTTLTAAETGMTSLATFGVDLVRGNEAIRFDIRDGTYSEAVLVDGNLTTSATCKVTWQAESTSTGWDGTDGSGVVWTHPTGTSLIVRDDDHHHFLNTQFESGNNFGQAIQFCAGGAASVGTVLENCLVNTTTNNDWGLVVDGTTGSGSAAYPVTIKNCVFTGLGRDGIRVEANTATDVVFVDIIHCTFEGMVARGIEVETTAVGAAVNLQIINCLGFNNTSADYATEGTVSGTITTAGSTNNVGEYNGTGEFPGGHADNPYTPTTSLTPGAGTWAIYDATDYSLVRDADNDAMGIGVGPDSNALVPATDIVGTPRYGDVCDPGAWQVPLSTLGGTVGSNFPTGRDYASITTAEAVLATIGTGTDLTRWNEEIVFDLYADSDFTTSDTIGGGLTTDPVRRVTFRAAAGQRHDGTVGSGGARWLRAADHIVDITDDHTLIEGIEFEGTSTLFDRMISVLEGTIGVTLSQCVLSNASANQNAIWIRAVASGSTHGSAAYPTTVVNCAFYGAMIAVNQRATTGAATLYYNVINCTGLSTSGSQNLLYRNMTNTSATCVYKVINCLAIDYNQDQGIQFGTEGTVTTTGSTNNYGETTGANELPGVGTIHPVTPTTTDAPGTDVAIYVSSTNAALLNSVNNDAIGQGIGPANNALVPTTDILGVARTGNTTDPGAWMAVTVGGGAANPSILHRNAALRALLNR